jgi:hypothetical protein
LAFNDSKLVLNTSHGFSDGGYLKLLTERLFDPPPSALPPIPSLVRDLLPAEFASARNIARPWVYDGSLTRFLSRHSDLGAGSHWCKYETLRIPAEDLQCYDRATGRLDNTTDYLWLALLLASAVPGGAIPTYAGISTCADMRRRLQSKTIDYSILKFFSHLNATAAVPANATLREVGRRMRSDLFRRSDDLEDVARIKFLHAPVPDPPIPGAVLEVTNMGPLRIKWPVLDAWASIRLAADFGKHSLSIMTFSVVGEKKKEIVVRLRYGDGEVGDDEAFAIAKMIDHVLRRISLETTVKAAWEELRQFYADNQ